MVTVKINKDVHGHKSLSELQKDLPHIPEAILKEWLEKHGKKKPAETK